MIARRLVLPLLLLVLAALAPVGAAQAAPAPIWGLNIVHSPTNFTPGGTAEYWIDVNNVGDAPTSGPITLTVDLPSGVTFASTRMSEDFLYYIEGPLGWQCPSPAGSTTVVCTTTGSILRHALNRELALAVKVSPSLEESDVFAKATIEGGGAGVATAVERTRISAQEADFGFVPDSFTPDFFKADARTVEREAGAHPDLLTVPFDLNTIASPTPQVPYLTVAHESLHDISMDLPPGFVMNPTAVGDCTPADLTWGACPASSQVGRIDVRVFPLIGLSSGSSSSTTGVFNISHPRGVISDFALQVGNAPTHFKVTLNPANRYALRVSVDQINELRPLFSQLWTFWGVPADRMHDSERCPLFTTRNLPGVGGYTGGECSAGAVPKPFITVPSQCETDNTARLHHYDSWQNRGTFGPEVDYTLPGKMTDCGRPRFEPDVEIVPTGKQANTPSGLDLHVKIAQNENPNALATPPVKRFTVRLPEGMSFSPSFADGLGGCSLSQMGLGTNDPVECPDSSRIGEVALRTPLLPRPLEGSMYVASQGDNPFGSLFALYLVLHDTEERGVLVKIPGRIDVDPATGRIVTVFNELPQFPYEDLTLEFRHGPRAPLVSPPSCGAHTIGVEVASYAQPRNPVDASNTYQVSEGPNGTPCPPESAKRPFAPRFSAGSLNPVAGAYSTFLFRLAREDPEQELSQITAVLPKGLLAKLAGVRFCPERAIASISATEGSGARELKRPACPATSQFGSISAGMGAGPGPNYFDGKVYLAGPYKGAPLSMAVVMPALAGPFDFGNVVVRVALYVDPQTLQVKAVSDPFPTILHGVILRVRDVRVRLDRPQTPINPTSCARTSVGGRITGVGGDLQSTADDSLFSTEAPFQVGSCGDLPFGPRFALRLLGGTQRGAHPKLRATLRMPQGDANVASASVVLPRSEFLEQSHIDTVCTRVQFAADACPPASAYGTAVAWSPLLDEPLKGKVYLRSSSHTLPDIAVALEGKVDVDLIGRINSVAGGIRTIFDTTPDAPIDSFSLTLAGGSKGLLVNSTDICQAPSRATARFGAHNGDRAILRPELKSSCAGGGRRGAGKRR